MKKLRQEFYDNFIGKSIIEVNAGIIASKNIDKVERYFSTLINEHCQMRTIMKMISEIITSINSGDIYKKTIFSYFSEYPKLDVLRAIYKLSDNSIKIVFKFCSLEENSEYIEETSKNDLKEFKKILNKIENILKGKVKLKDFYSYFLGYTKEEILLCMETLSVYEKCLIFKKYGDNLDGNGMCVTEEEKRIITFVIVKRMKRYLKLIRDGYQVLGLNNLYPHLTLKEIKYYIDLLSEKQKKYFYEMFGSNLNRKRIARDINSLVNSTYKNALDKKIYISSDRKLKPFFLIFESFRKEDESLEDFKVRVIDAVNTLNPRDIKDMLLIYGEDFENSLMPSEITKKQIRNFTCNIVPSIKNKLGKLEYDEIKRKKRIKNSYSKRFFEYFPLIREDYINDLFSYKSLYKELLSLNNSEKELLIKRFGNNLDEINNVSKKELEEIIVIINKIRRRLYLRISKELNISLYKINIIVDLFNNWIFKEIDFNIDNNIIVAVLVYLYVNNISEEEIIKVLGVDPLEYLESVKSILEEKGISKKMVIGE